MGFSKATTAWRFFSTQSLHRLSTHLFKYVLNSLTALEHVAAALHEICHFQKSFNLLMSKTSFKRLMKEIMNDPIVEGMRMQCSSLSTCRDLFSWFSCYIRRTAMMRYHGARSRISTNHQLLPSASFELFCYH